MPINFNFTKGIDFPVWQWLPFNPFISYHGTSNVYDGVRYMYYVTQSGTTSAAASTTYLTRFDTWSNGWSYVAQLTNSGYGLDIEYDRVRNVLYIIHAAGLTSWQVYNLNLTAVTIGGVTVQPFSLATMAPVLPASTGYGASITLPDEQSVTGTIDSGSASSGTTATVIYDTNNVPSFGSGMVGLQIRFTSGNVAGQKRTIASVQSISQLTVAPGFTAAPTVGSEYIIELQDGTASAGTTADLTDAAKSWAANQYRDSDVVITGGTGSGQRRRIASNTATVLTVATAFATAPDTTSTYDIVPSSDLLYFQRGSAGPEIYMLDLSAATLAWSVNLGSMPAAPSGGGNTFHPQAYGPHSIIAFRGAGTRSVYQFSIGLRTWATLPSHATNETFSTGSSATMLHGHRRIFTFKEGTNRAYAYDVTTGIFEPFPTIPYAFAPGYDGKRARMVRTPDGVSWLYLLRAGGQEFFRVPIEWDPYG